MPLPAGLSPNESLLLKALGDHALLVDERGAITGPGSPTAPPRPLVESRFPLDRYDSTFANWPAVLAHVRRTRVPLLLHAALHADQSPLPTIVCCPILAEDRPAEPSRTLLITIGGDQGEAEFARHELNRRLAALGKLAAQVAHELNNPLDGIMRYVNLAIRLAKDEDMPRLHDYLRESQTGLKRMVQIITDLLEFTRNADDSLQVTDVNEIVEEAIRAHANLAERHRVVVASDFQSAHMPQVRGNRLFQVCSNLVRNAIEAMPDGGRLTVTTGLTGDRMMIRVSDTGPGLPADPEQVFQPFFTTKAAKQGTGIGLAICKDLIEDMSGTITARNATAEDGDEGGAVFTVLLPMPTGRTDRSSNEDT